MVIERAKVRETFGSSQKQVSQARWGEVAIGIGDSMGARDPPVYHADRSVVSLLD
ncbi:hypothetical protein D3C87_1685020 [compost metagenome]